MNPTRQLVSRRGWWTAHRFLLLRRISQFSVLLAFLLGPWMGLWLIQGNLASSLVLGVLPLTDPLLALQVLLAHGALAETALLGAGLVSVFYLLLGGRVYCAWVCPVNVLTDLAAGLRRLLRIKGGTRFSSRTRYGLLLAILLLSLFTGTLAWELVNPVSLLFRGLVFGMGAAWGVAAGIFLLDLLVARNAWCGHLCPVGAFYSLLGKVALLRVRADNRSDCDDCMDCFAVCPEPQVIVPALRGADRGLGPVILSGECSNCGRCIDVCAPGVFRFGHRFSNQLPESAGTQHREVLS